MCRKECAKMGELYRKNEIISLNLFQMNNLKNTIKLLRFPFSFFLLPVSLFSFYYIHPEFNASLVLVIIIWHLLVFPASNGFNSYNDQDEGPIGGLAAPPKPTKILLYIANGMDLSAIALSFLINIPFAVFVILYILFSRLYSYRKIRFKQYPIGGFLVVFIFQGAWIFCANIVALAITELFSNPTIIFSAIACSFFIATVYPLTQIYQHDADKADGVKTLSMALGKKGTFIFSGSMFFLATLFIFLAFQTVDQLSNFWLFNIIMLPATLFFLSWAYLAFKKESFVNFKNTMIMLVLSSLSLNIYFTVLLIQI
jgi:1,4-dihydroxy-2-naphthoate octaprenyltransferase